LHPVFPAFWDGSFKTATKPPHFWDEVAQNYLDERYRWDEGTKNGLFTPVFWDDVSETAAKAVAFWDGAALLWWERCDRGCCRKSLRFDKKKSRCRFELAKVSNTTTGVFLSWTVL